MAREIDLYQIGSTPEQLQSALQALRADYDAHNHDGTSSRAFETLHANTISTQTFLIKKTSYTDNTSGIWMGFVNGVMKLKLGGASQFLDWDGTTLTVTGTISGTTFSGITILGSTLTGNTVTGGTVRTSSGTTRVEMNGTDNALYFYNDGNIQLAVDQNGLTINTPLGVSSGFIQGAGSNALWINVDSGGPYGIEVNSGAVLPLEAAGGMDLGDASDYFGEVNYKTLTDRGCLGWFDDGVELNDGRKVSDTEALLAIRPHPTRKTPRGATRIDYKTMPKHVYTPAADKGVLLPRDENDEPYKMVDGVKKVAQDGAETTALIAIMLGAIKELTLRVKELELSTQTKE